MSSLSAPPSKKPQNCPPPNPALAEPLFFRYSFSLMANVAVIRTGGKQHKVSEGEILEIERLTVAPGSSAEFSDVLLLVQDAKVQVGKPTVSGAKVVAEVVAHDRAPKVVAFKYRRREGYHRTVGHRQSRTRIKIQKIQAGK